LLLCAPQIGAAEPLPDPTLPAIGSETAAVRATPQMCADDAVPRGLQSHYLAPISGAINQWRKQ